MKKPNQEAFSTKISEYYMATDMHVGASVEINKHKFLLIDADEYAFLYMEQHADEVGAHTSSHLPPPTPVLVASEHISLFYVTRPSVLMKQ